MWRITANTSRCVVLYCTHIANPLPKRCSFSLSRSETYALFRAPSHYFKSWPLWRLSGCPFWHR